MLSIGEFSRICKVSTNTLRYYAEIGLILPKAINPETGYRYYDVAQFETMMLINRLKSYHFSLDEIKGIIHCECVKEDALYHALAEKKQELRKQLQVYVKSLKQLDQDLLNLAHGSSIMTFTDDLDIQLVEVEEMHLLSIRTLVPEEHFPEAYADCFGNLSKDIQDHHLTVAAPPMVLFHSDEFTPSGLDTEFAIPVKECAIATRSFNPGLCVKTVVKQDYAKLPSVYAKQIHWAEQEGYVCTDALFEVYVSDPTDASDEHELITEVYYPVKKKG